MPVFGVGPGHARPAGAQCFGLGGGSSKRTPAGAPLRRQPLACVGGSALGLLSPKVCPYPLVFPGAGCLPRLGPSSTSPCCSRAAGAGLSDARLRQRIVALRINWPIPAPAELIPRRSNLYLTGSDAQATLDYDGCRVFPVSGLRPRPPGAAICGGCQQSHRRPAG